MSPAPPKPARHLRALDGGASASEDDRCELIERLVREAQAGDEQAWTTLYRHTYDGLYRHIGYLVQDPSVAEDLTQESFARACSHLERFDGRSRFETWLHGIAINIVRTHWRGSGRRARAHHRLARHLAHAGPARTGNPELSHTRKQRAAALLEIVAALPPKLREAYVLVDLREIERTEAATLLGISVANVSVRASRARAKVREELTRRGWLELQP